MGHTNHRPYLSAYRRLLEVWFANNQMLDGFRRLSLDMTADDARFLSIAADKFTLIADCLTEVARLRLAELESGPAND